MERVRSGIPESPLCSTQNDNQRDFMLPGNGREEGGREGVGVWEGEGDADGGDG